MDKTQPVGIFDSGLGGLTVATHLYKEMPQESTIYVADQSRVPYGPLPKETVARYVIEICDFLVDQGVKAIVIACNTATAAGLETAQREIKVPVIGVIKPGSRMAARTTRNKRVAVLATEGTTKSQAYPNEIKSLLPGAEVFGQACPRFTELVEGGMKDPKEIDAAVAGYLKNIENAGYDTLVFGCTHYPLLKDYIEARTPAGVEFVNPAVETVEDLKKVLAGKDLLNDSGVSTRVYYTSGNTATFREIASMIIGLTPAQAQAMDIRRVDWKIS
ncbi:MAG: glutamate racemase [Bacillota bacterium]|nr:glutamate racemase [Bacillota bacterium]